MNPRATFLSAVLFLIFGSRLFAGTFEKIESSFELPNLAGNPFDFTANDVKVSIDCPDHSTRTLPAFFDGGKIWRVRHSPTAAGKYRIQSITLNGADAHAQNISRRDFEVSGSPTSRGFIRIDDHNRFRFVFDDDSTFYPIGYDLAWRSTTPPMPQLTESLARMGKAKVNWSRIWMNHWDGKNLDWLEAPQGQRLSPEQPELGKLSLPVAKHWDEIIDAADANHVYFQMVLQHHGQYSTGADANWQINPWNKANGGWLENASQFFTDPKAIALTKNKYRYIVARWGYSPAVMTFELFNEVESVDAFAKNFDDVAAWHKTMADFIREQDSYHHLITTSSYVDRKPLWPAMDYYQAHAYPPDILAAIDSLDAEKLDRAYFLGEIGGGDSNDANAQSKIIHPAIWGSLMSNSSGAAQYWFWYLAEPNNLLYHYTFAQDFIEQSNLLDQRDLKPIEIVPDTGSRGPLTFGPGIGWAASKTTHFNVKPSGIIEGLGGMSAYLQGKNANRAMFPDANFQVDFPSAGTFKIDLDEITPDGARLEVSIDGATAAVMNINAPPQLAPTTQNANRPRRNPRLDTSLELPISAGKHEIRLENTGPDWIHLRKFTLDPYAPALAALGKANNNFAVVWVYRRDDSVTESINGKLAIPGLDAGKYQVTWFDPNTGKIVREDSIDATANRSTEIQTPPIQNDLAAWIRSSVPRASSP